MEIVERRSAAMKLERSMFALEPKCDVKQAGGRSSVKPKSDDIWGWNAHMAWNLDDDREEIQGVPYAQV